MSETTTLIPKFTIEDFMSDRVYEWLYQNKDNKYMLQQLLNKVQVVAKELKFPGFMKTWNAYVESKSPKATILGSNQTLFPNQPTQLDCGQYIADEYGVSRMNELGAEVEVISHPLMPVKRVTNIETFEEKLEIAYQRGKDPWKTLTVSREQLASAQKIIGLSRQGVDVNSENAKEVVRFMSKLESLNYDALPKQNSVSHMGWLHDGKFMPYVEDVSYDGDSPEFLNMYNEFKPTGDEETWLNLAKEVRKADSIPARIALASSFAAPLVQILGGLPFFVHFWGETGCGKTVALMLAASVWGNPDVGRYIKTFSGTKVSQELYAAFCCNLPILFDELQVISDRKTFDDIIYMLCEGVSKGRGAKEGGLQVQKRWSSCIITTGEMPITQGNSGGGAVARIVEVNFGGVPLFKDARTTANMLKEHYGFAGPKFIEMLHRDGVIDSLKTLQKRFYAELMQEDVQDKQVLSASIILAADALATKSIFNDKRALTVNDIKDYLVSRTETDVNLRCYNWLMGYCAANPRHFDPDEQSISEVWGKYDNKEGYIYINRTILEGLLKNNGYSPGAFIDWAKRKSMLQYESHGKGSNNNRLTKRYKGVPHYVIKLPDEEKTEQEAYKEYVQVDDPDMPF